MSDRLPEPQRSSEVALVERASATPNRRAPLPKGPAPTKGRVPRTLSEIQEWVIDGITKAPPDDLGHVITSGPRLGAAERFAVYQSGYYARLVECLIDDYPVTAAALGEERFGALAEAYIQAHPSSAPSLNAYGRHFAAFCEGAVLLAPNERPFFRDLARLEWALVEVIHARSAAALDAGALREIPVEAFATARFEPSPAVRLLHLDHPANAFYRAYREFGVVPPLPDPSPSATVVYRAGPVLWRMDLTAAMARVLGALLDRKPLGEALGAMETDESDLEALAEAERNVMVWFREWVEGAMFTALSFDP